MAERTKPTEDDINHSIVDMLVRSRAYSDESLEPDRENALEYYRAEKLGNEEDGRSQVVMSTVRDTIAAILPSLMRTLAGPFRAVEFRPRELTDIKPARQRTDYVNYVIMEENNGFMEIYAAAKDALKLRLGVTKWWWESNPRVEVTDYEGLTMDQAVQFEADPKAEIEITAQDPERGTVDATVKYTRLKGRGRFAAVPAEEIKYLRGTRSVEGAVFVAHERELREDEILALGYSLDEIEEHLTVGSDDDNTNETSMARTRDGQYETPASTRGRSAVFAECYTLIDRDGDGAVELVRADVIGKGTQAVLKILPVSHIPLAFWIPDPEPHTTEGLSAADLSMDLQKIESMIWRGMLDSLAEALIPRQVVQEDDVEMSDVYNKEVSAVIRARKPGAVESIVTPFVGAAAIPVLDKLEEKKEQRSGQSRGSQGLQPDALQSTTAAAVAAQVNAGQQRLELISRLLAQGGLRQTFQGVARMLHEHQDIEAVVQLNNEWVPVNPSDWDGTYDMKINVGVGQGGFEERRAALEVILQEQKTHLQVAGANGPMVTLIEYRRTIEKWLEITQAGFVDEFFKPITEEELLQADRAALAAGQNQPNEQEGLLEIERQKIEIEAAKLELKKVDQQTQMQLDQAKLQLAEQDLLLKDDRERDKQAADIALKMKELELRFSGQVDETEMRERVETIRAELQADAQKFAAETSASRPKRKRKVEIQRDDEGRSIGAMVTEVAEEGVAVDG